ncbi:hypothetical protein [Phenylobacterium deserti]|uniref:hypothetical protein n=1 Tax=Phenylobacterium deserti TaxID=1914756 RepID=UPI001057DEDE|nr:hypothetical protein [Phenylobacterium deserti]
MSAAHLATAPTPRLCTEPEELYGSAAGETIGHLLQPWLARQSVTPFELLHRADLAMRLDGAGTDLQQALQKVAVPAALARGDSVHEIIRQLQRLTDRALSRLTRHAREAPTPELTAAEISGLAQDLHGSEDDSLRLGFVIARRLGSADGWSGKLTVLLDIAQAAPHGTPARDLLLGLLERPLREVLRQPAAWGELFGGELSLGAAVAVDLALADRTVFTALARVQPSLAASCPPLSPVLERLGEALQAGLFPKARQDLHRRMLAAFAGRGRLRPGSAFGEIEMLRLLGAALTAASGPLMPEEDVREALVARSSILLEPAFLGALIGPAPDAFNELGALALVLETVAGDANRRRAVRLLDDTVATRRLHRAVSETQGHARVASLRERIARASVGVGGAEALLARLDEFNASR